jgi:multiple sugar transport system substrate-binding protein
MRHARKLMVFVLIALLFTLVLTQGTFGASKTVITHWQHSSSARDKMMQQLAEEFMQSHPDVEVEVQVFPLNEFLDKVLVALAGGAGPDTVQVRSTWMQGLIKAGLLFPLDSNVITAEEIERDFVPPAIAPLQANGEYYALPTDAQSIVLFYQPELFELAGLDSTKPPTTWDELIAMAKKVHKRDAQGKTTQMGVATGGYAPVLFTLMHQAGASLWDPVEQLPLFNTPEAVNGLKFAVDLVIEHGVEDRTFGSRWTAFRSEKLGMVYAHPAMKGSFLSTHPNLKFNIAEIPAATADGDKSSLLTTWALGLTKTENSEIATKWLLYVQSHENQQRWLSETGELPTRWSVIRRPEYQRDSDLRAILWSMPTSFPVPWISDDILNLATAAWNVATNLQDSIQNQAQILQDKAVVAEREAQTRSFR